MPKTDRITQAEMIELFGEAMPIEAVELLWSAPGDRTLGELRAELRRIADEAHLRSTSPAGDVGEIAAWAWLDEMVSALCDEDPSDLAYSADQMVDAFMAGQRLAASDTEAMRLLDEDDIAEMLNRAAAPYVQRKGSSGLGPWCKEHGVNKAHAHEFINRQRAPTSDLLAALGIKRTYARIDAALAKGGAS